MGQFTTLTVEEPDSAKVFASDEPVRLGVEHFNRGDFGLAERYFRAAVEKMPRNAAAWIGLAASYDRLLRFDFADRSYAQAIMLAGETAQILNNQGYSYLLRGNFRVARVKFLQAEKESPHDRTIANNITLLEASADRSQHDDR